MVLPQSMQGSVPKIHLFIAMFGWYLCSLVSDISIGSQVVGSMSAPIALQYGHAVILLCSNQIILLPHYLSECEGTPEDYSDWYA